MSDWRTAIRTVAALWLLVSGAALCLFLGAVAYAVGGWWLVAVAVLSGASIHLPLEGWGDE